MVQQKRASTHITANFQGENGGQLAVGQYIYQNQIGDIYGGVVNIATPEQSPEIRKKSIPIALLPRRFDNLVGRRAEIGRTIATLQYAQPIEFYSREGMGKSVLIRHLAHQLKDNPSFPDGIIYRSVRNLHRTDLLQFLFESFYESDIPFIPSETDIIHWLQSTNALIFLDDIAFSRNELDDVINGVVPNSTFCLTSNERHLWEAGHSQNLQGLEPKDALALVEREWRRPLTSEEQVDAHALCVRLEGHPLDILQATALAKVEKRSLTTVAQKN